MIWYFIAGIVTIFANFEGISKSWNNPDDTWYGISVMVIIIGLTWPVWLGLDLGRVINRG